MKICIIVGTRPEIIKMSPIIRECISRKIDYYILHTGQHYSYNMDFLFFEELELPHAQYKLDTGEKYKTHGAKTGEMIKGIEEVLMMDKPSIVLVEGDTDTVLSGAIASVKLHIPIGHVEAGLRSHDRRMPEEINRILTDHSSDLLFAPTEESKDNLLNEGISENKIYVTGNTIVDAVLHNIKIAKRKNVAKNLGLNEDFILLTLHREENVDDKKVLMSILEGLNVPYQIVYPIHPRTRKNIESFKLKVPENILVIEPLGYMDFLNLLYYAKLVATDSGGVQEESCILGTPCITIRTSTERPETVKVGANRVVGVDGKNIRKEICHVMETKCDKKWKNPFGDGKASNRIIDIILDVIS